MLDILLELDIRRFQFRNRAFQLMGHFIEVLPEPVDFIVRLSAVLGVEIQIRHFLGNFCKLDNRLRKSSRQK